MNVQLWHVNRFSYRDSMKFNLSFNKMCAFNFIFACWMQWLSSKSINGTKQFLFVTVTVHEFYNSRHIWDKKFLTWTPYLNVAMEKWGVMCINAIGNQATKCVVLKRHTRSFIQYIATLSLGNILVMHCKRQNQFRQWVCRRAVSKLDVFTRIPSHHVCIQLE